MRTAGDAGDAGQAARRAPVAGIVRCGFGPCGRREFRESEDRIGNESFYTAGRHRPPPAARSGRPCRLGERSALRRRAVGGVLRAEGETEMDDSKKSLTSNAFFEATLVAESREPRAESREPRAESREPRAESREPRAESREPRAESREPRAESREPRAESREPRAESREPRAESREPRAESREPRAESREPRAESREPRAESRELGYVCRGASCPG